MPKFLRQLHVGEITALGHKAVMRRLSIAANRSDEQVKMSLALLAGSTGCDFSSISNVGWTTASKAYCSIPDDVDVTPELFI